MSKYALTNRGRVFIKKGKAKPLWNRHPWVFSGAVHNVKGSPGDGDVVEVFDDNNDFIAKGFFNLRSQIMVRLLSWDLHEKIDREFFHKKIDEALWLRERTLALTSKTNAYRLIHSEGDGLPGLTVDRYNNVLVGQFLSTGMDQRRDMIIDILKQETKTNTLVEHYAPKYRELEGLPELDYLAHGDKPPEQITIQEYGLQFQVNLMKGQKTGFYLDQRENRAGIVSYGYHKKVLDAFSYTGAFGIYLLAKGKAAAVTFMDSSGMALKMAEENIALNRIEGSTQFVKADLFKELPAMAERGEKFDIVVLDPPKVAPDRSSLDTALISLKIINAAAIQMLTPGGVLVTCDCSGIIGWEEYLRTLSVASREAKRPLRIIQFQGAGPDHPVNPACPESQYLKVVVAGVA